MGRKNREETVRSLDHFEKLIKPVRLHGITSRTIADFVVKRSKEQGLREGTVVSPASVNKELRYLRAVLRRAYKWGFLPKPIDFDFLKEPQKLPTYIPPEHFAQLYQGCDQARLPADLPFLAADWWRGLLITAYMTGWRISALLALKRVDVDLNAGTAISRAADNKGKRDQKIPLHQVAVEHLRKLRSFEPVIFPWNYARRLLSWPPSGDARIPRTHPEGEKARYGFHDLRRAFATMNADRLTADALQFLMQHKDYQTTQRYIAMARQLNPAVQNLYVPDVSKVAASR